MNQAIRKMALFLVAIVLFGWIGYHIVYYNRDIVETETIFKETISRSLSGKGIAIRTEQVLPKTGTGAERFLYEDGARVGIGQPIVEYYSGTVENRNIQNISIYQQEILALEEAQNKSINNFSTAGIISRGIREQLAMLSKVSSTGNCDDLTKLSNNLTDLVNRRDIAIGNSEDYEHRITEVKNELEKLTADGNLDSIQKGITPISGFFAKRCDGYENMLTPEIIADYKVSDFIEIIGENAYKPTNIKSDSGRIITDSKWYFVIDAPVHEIEWVKIGQQVELSFGHITKPIPAAVGQLIIENNNPDAIVIFTSDYISEDIVNLRNADVTVSFSQFSGLKIDVSSIRFDKDSDGQDIRGVYILENHVARFKKIDTVYEESSFVLSRTNYSDSQDKDYVKLYDKVIVQGNDIYNGKIIQ